MRIVKLVIYGFGKHQNVTINLSERITVFLGENEAGKTTIYQFILQILFGFPPKNHALIRYEPKTGAPYGGKIILSDNRFGNVTIERVRGKSAGDVSITYSDGTVGGQEELSELLRQYDRQAYESVHSFSLFQLQGLQEMDTDELSRTLLSSGTTGIDTLLQLEKRLEKEKNDLFKKSGKNPKMNVMLNELRELENKLKAERAKITEYEPATKRLYDVEQAIEIESKKKEELEKLTDQLKDAQLRLPILANREKLITQITSLNMQTFPPNGIREQEILETKKLEAEAEITKLRYQLEEITDRLQSSSQPEKLNSLENLLSKESDWQSLQRRMDRLQADIHQLQSEQHGLLVRLGALTTEEMDSIRKIDSSLATEQRVLEAADEVHRITRIRESCELDWQRAKETEQRAKTQVSSHRNEAPTDEQLNQAKQWQSIRPRLAEAKAYMSYSQQSLGKPFQNNSWVVLLFALLFTVYGFIQGQWIITLFGLLLAIVTSLGYMKNKQNPGDLDKRKEEMEALVKAYEGKEESLEELCRRVDDYKRREEQLKPIYEREALIRENLENTLERLEKDEEKALAYLQDELISCGLPLSSQTEVIRELFRLHRELQDVDRQLQERGTEQRNVHRLLEQHKEQAENLLMRDLPQTDLYNLLRQEAFKLREQTSALESDHRQQVTFKRLIDEKKFEMQSYNERERKLFERAGVPDKTAFYEAFDRWQEVQTLQSKLKGIEEQLNDLDNGDAFGDSEAELTAKSKQLSEERAASDERLSKLKDERAALLHKTETLLTEESHLLTQQLFESKKAEFNELAIQWSSRQAAAEAIRQTMGELKEKKLPSVLTRANELFAEITGGAYETIEIADNDHFLAKRMDGQSFEIVELSQATKEQAYLALRFALAEELLEEAPFPIMMDDPFVHFDAIRLSRILKMLNGLSVNHQFILFTCHKNVAAQWPEATIINVSEIGNDQEAIMYENVTRA